MKEQGREESVGIFKLDPERFDTQLKLLVSAGDRFDSARKKFYGNVIGSSEIWSGLNELDQFGSPLRDSVTGIDGRLGQISSRYKRIVSDLQRAVQDFRGIDENQRKAYMTMLNGLNDKFTYNSTNTPER